MLLTEADLLLKRTVREFAEREVAPRAAHRDETEEFPWEGLRGLATLGLTGLSIDAQYGGSGGGYTQLAIVMEELARACPATSLTYLAHLSLAAATIHTFGTPAQKARWLPPLVRADKIGAFCLTEPGAGSDAAGIQTTATPRDGGYILRGTKNFITNGHVAHTLVVFATEDPALRAKGVSCFVVERGARGLSTGRMPGKMGMRASDTAEVYLEDVPVSEGERIGEAREGFKVAMLVLDASRVCIAAQAVGIAQAALEAAVKYAVERHAFGKPIADLQAVQFMLADMATQVEAGRLLTLQAGIRKDRGQPFIQEASMAKLFASEAASFCTDRALQIFGGYGYFRPTPVERLFRDARVIRIYEGTSEVQRLIIARQLLQGLHP